MSTTTLPRFAHITITEIAELIKADAPASVLAIWSILCSFDYSKRGTCFPKISTIKKLLESTGGTFREGKIYWALSWLEEKGFLTRNQRRSRKRFELNLRQESIAQMTKGQEFEEYRVGNTNLGQQCERRESNHNRDERIRTCDPKPKKKRKRTNAQHGSKEYTGYSSNPKPPTYDRSESNSDKPTTDESRRENLRNRKLSPPQTPPQREGAKRKGRKARKREEQQRIDTQLAHSKALTAYCEEVAGYLWIKDRPDLSHLSNPTPRPMGCFTLTELKNEVQHHNSLSYQQVGRQRIWDWLKQNHK